MGEFSLIRDFFSRPTTGDGIVIGVGDDAAVLEPRPGCEQVIATDTLVEGVHFPALFDASDLGFRSVQVNLSDLAAMGAEPAWMTLALTHPDGARDWVAGFADGLYAAATEGGIELVGGDTTRGPNIVVTVTVIGHVPSGAALARSGAAAGELIWISGWPGNAAAGLRLQDATPLDEHHELLQRFRRPTARVGLGRALRGIATSCIDVSDGLLQDLGHITAASGVAAQIDLDALPLSAALKSAFPADAETLALTGGDDYELCFTASPRDAALVSAAATTAGTEVTAIGRILDGTGLSALRGGAPVELPAGGFDHFGNAS